MIHKKTSWEMVFFYRIQIWFIEQFEFVTRTPWQNIENKTTQFTTINYTHRKRIFIPSIQYIVILHETHAVNTHKEAWKNCKFLEWFIFLIKYRIKNHFRTLAMIPLFDYGGYVAPFIFFLSFWTFSCCVQCLLCANVGWKLQNVVSMKKSANYGWHSMQSNS